MAWEMMHEHQYSVRVDQLDVRQTATATPGRSLESQYLLVPAEPGRSYQFPHSALMSVETGS